MLNVNITSFDENVGEETISNKIVGKIRTKELRVSKQLIPTFIVEVKFVLCDIKKTEYLLNKFRTYVEKHKVSLTISLYINDKEVNLSNLK